MYGDILKYQYFWTMYSNSKLFYHTASFYRKIYGDQARYFEMELKPKIKHTKRGLISFVNNGNNQHGSQVRIQEF